MAFNRSQTEWWRPLATPFRVQMNFYWNSRIYSYPLTNPSHRIIKSLEGSNELSDLWEIERRAVVFVIHHTFVTICNKEENILSDFILFVEFEIFSYYSFCEFCNNPRKRLIYPLVFISANLKSTKKYCISNEA